eukprot:TRINITY_DN20088_c0_g1_i1.p1 TRINITY_DN20088_c0_g1~~TRINITY_DN20088_c0_g1_i1.p1  ORF type:complete len:163 (+),score=21.57 TRINITY_DN20088_c0_g1_i1:43-531(+)
MFSCPRRSRPTADRVAAIERQLHPVGGAEGAARLLQELDFLSEGSNTIFIKMNPNGIANVRLNSTSTEAADTVETSVKDTKGSMAEEMKPRFNWLTSHSGDYAAPGHEACVDYHLISHSIYGRCCADNPTNEHAMLVNPLIGEKYWLFRSNNHIFSDNVTCK